MTRYPESGVTSEPSKSLYRRWLDELWAGSEGAAARLVTEDFLGHWPGEDVVGPEALARKIAETRGMFDELVFELEVGPVVDGDLVAARWTGVASTPQGPMTFSGNDILKVRDDRFAEYWTASSAGA